VIIRSFKHRVCGLQSECESESEYFLGNEVVFIGYIGPCLDGWLHVHKQK